MTIPKEAIEKAIAGGWSFIHTDLPWSWTGYAGINGEHEFTWQTLALDPSFWQSLGKVLGWKEIGGKPSGSYFENYTWLGHAHRFYDLILTGGDTDSFWQDLLGA